MKLLIALSDDFVPQRVMEPNFDFQRFVLPVNSKLSKQKRCKRKKNADKSAKTIKFESEKELIMNTESLSAVKKHNPALLAAAMRASPKISKQVKDITEKIKHIHKTAILVYKKRKATDAKKKAEREAHKTKNVKHVAHSAGAEGAGADEHTPITETAVQKKDKAKQLKKVDKKAQVAKMRKLVSSAMRIRENKKLNSICKKLKAGRAMLREKAWKAYIVQKGKKVADVADKASEKANGSKSAKKNEFIESHAEAKQHHEDAAGLAKHKGQINRQEYHERRAAHHASAIKKILGRDGAKA